MKKRLLAAILVVALALTSMTTMVFALTFNDVENDPTVSWAKAAINQMTEAGYIKGYEDGTYKPYRAISKLECLLLMARILGSEEADYAAIAEAAELAYTDIVSKYNTNYLGELTYLMYLGIIDETDLASYASAANANTELLRHQAAILMAKMAGRNTEAKGYSTVSEYADSATIPSISKAYVEFVTAKGIMNGMDKTEDGRPQFSPLTSLTRAQMATLLSRMIDLLDKNIYEATIEGIDLENNVIAMEENGSVKECAITADAAARLEGEAIELVALKEGSVVEVIEIDGHIQLIDIIKEGSGIQGTVVYGKISMLTAAAGNNKITLVDAENSNSIATYAVDENCTYTVKGAKAVFSDFSKGNFVKAVVEDDVIVSLAVADSTATVEGTLKNVGFDEENHVYITVANDFDGEQEYVVSSKGAKVERDGEMVEYRDLAIGDAVILTLSYGKITDVVATSNAERFSGTLTSIVIAKKPYLTVEVDGEERTLYLKLGAKIKLAGVEATLYELRPGNQVNGILDGEEIRILNASAVIDIESGEFRAVVENINTSYKVITVVDGNDEKHSIYYNAKTNILKNTGDATVARNIKVGDTLDITGVEKNGLFEATIIIIK